MELTTNQGLKNQIKDTDDILELAAPFFCILCFILIKYSLFACKISKQINFYKIKIRERERELTKKKDHIIVEKGKEHISNDGFALVKGVSWN